MEFGLLCVKFASRGYSILRSAYRRLNTSSFVLTVRNPPQHEAVRWRSHPREAAIFPGKHSLELVGLEFSEPDLHEGPGDAAAHFVEKTVPLDNESDERSFLFYFTSKEGSHGGGTGVAGIGSKGAEIMFAEEMNCSLGHELAVQRTRHMPGGVAEQGIHGGIIPNDITILLAGGIEPGVEIRASAHS